MRMGAVLVGLLLAVAGCTSSGPGGDQGAAAPSAAPPDDVAAPALRDELLGMMRDDQVERTGEGLPPGATVPPMDDRARAARLEEIIAEHGWPTHRLVGADGGTAAWIVAQHADFDVEFQEQVVGLMTAAVQDGQASPGNLAYLQDRVAVNRGLPQRYGTQVGCRDGVPAPATPLTDPEGIDGIRASAGLGTLADYYRELATMCANEAAGGSSPPT